MYTFNIYDFYIKGGVFMHPILLCSIISLAIFMERLWSLRRKKVIPESILPKIEKFVREEKLSEAIGFCKLDNSSLSRVLLVGLKNAGTKREHLKEVIEEVGSREATYLERYIEALATIASISTLLGLLGTISGMIKIFSVISREVIVNPTTLAGGIAEALNTTAFGLVVAIPSTVFYKYLIGKVETMIVEMEEYSTHVVELLKGKEE
ncbi:MAG: MotA/TolQ/ExbB proton channel family protein [Deltaproteobacteria bacterium]|nr:MotA/TolQ/ExbB proton channel family protein [Deltaproteobacteria bacterium]